MARQPMLNISRLLRIWRAFTLAFALYAFISMASAAPIVGSQSNSSTGSNGFSVIDCVAIAIGATVMAGSRILSRCLNVNRTDLSLCLSACEAFTWWAAKSDDRSSPVFLIVYVR